MVEDKHNTEKSSRFWKFSDYVDLEKVPKGDANKYYSEIYKTWQVLDSRENNINGLKLADGKSAEQLDIIACRPNGKPTVVARIRNESPQKQSQPLSENDEANATLIARAPIMFQLLRMYLHCVKHRESVCENDALAVVTERVLEDIIHGKPYFILNNIFPELNEDEEREEEIGL